MTRRQSLGLAGLAGAGYIASRAAGLGDGAVDDGLGADPAAAATCTLAPSLTEGPFWEDERLNRADITGGQSGVPLELKLNIVDSDDGCSAYANATVDIWHANRDGNYSDEPAGIGNDDTLGQTWLRGFQTSNSNGAVTFETVWPGFYGGRTCHIHVRVRTFDANSDQTSNFTTQVFFDETANNAVAASYGATRDTTNANDGIYQQAGTSVLLVSPSGSVANGYSAQATVALSGLPASSTGIGGNGTSNDTSVDATLKRAKFTEHRGERRLQVKLDADETVSAKAKLVRHRKTIAHKNIDGLAAGTPKLEIPIKDEVEGGAAKLRLTLTDKTGNEKTLKQNVHVPG